MEEIKKLLNKLLAYGKDIDLGDPEVKSLLEELAKVSAYDPNAFDLLRKEATELSTNIKSQPRYKNVQTIKEVTAGIEGAVDLFNTFSNIATARRQIKDAEDAANELVRPDIPPVTPKSEELKAATEDARRQRTRPLRELDPLLQRNMDLLRSGLSASKTASTGQAGAYGSMAQNAVNNARRANNDLVPALEAARRQQDSQYYGLVNAGVREDQVRNSQLMARYNAQDRRYLQEAQAVGQLGAMGNYNLAAQRQGLGKALTSSLQPITQGLLNNLRFNSAQSQQQPLLQNSYNINNPNIGVQYGNISQAGQRLNKTYTTLGNINPKWDAFANKINLSLSGYFDPARRNGL